MSGIGRLLLHGPSAFDHPAGLMAKMCSKPCRIVAGSLSNMAFGRYEGREGTRMGRCSGVARWAVEAEPFAWGLALGVCCCGLEAQTQSVACVSMVACGPAGPARPLSVWERPGPTLAIYHGHHRFFMGTNDTVMYL